VSINAAMKIEGEDDIGKQNFISDDENDAIEEFDNDIKNLTLRKNILNNVLEKMIDKINQPNQDV
jgi:hypothetical protein